MGNLSWGLQITALGMGLVFALLGLLWGLLTLVLKLDKQPEPLASVETANASKAQLATEAEPRNDANAASLVGQPLVNGLPADLVAAIMVATLKHRMTLRQQAEPVMRSQVSDNLLSASRWVGTGRTRQNTTWQPRGK